MSSSSPSTHGTRTDPEQWSGVLRIAATRSTSARRERRWASDVPRICGRRAKAAREAARGSARRRARPGSRSWLRRSEVVARQPDELERQLIAPHASRPRSRARDGRARPPASGEVGHPPRGARTRAAGTARRRHPHRGRRALPRLDRARSRASDRIGVDVIDVRCREKRVEQRLDRRPCSLRVDEAARQVGDHLLVGHRRTVASGRRSSSQSPGKSAGPAVARSEPLPLIRSTRRSRPRWSPLDELRGGVPPPWSTSAGSADQPRARDELFQFRLTRIAATRAIVALLDRAHRGAPGSARRRDIDRLADLVAEQRGPERRRRRNGAGAADRADLDVIASPPSSTTSTTEPMPTSSPVACSTISALSSRWRSVRMRASAAPARSWPRGTRSSPRGRRTLGPS